MEKKLAKLGVKNRKILFELDLDSRQPFARLAKKVGLSKDAVIYRVNRLRELGVLGGFYTTTDSSKLGYRIVRVYIRFQDTTLEKEKEIIQFFVSQRRTFWVAETDGAWHLAVGFAVKKFQEFDDIWLDFEKKYKQFVGSQQIAVFVKYLHFRRDYLVGGRTKEIDAEGGGEIEKLDRKDYKLLELLANDARAPLLKLGKELDLSPVAVGKRIGRLKERGVILRFRANINLEAIGYKYYKVDLQLEDLNQLKKIEQFVFSLSNTVYAERSIGGSDFEFDVEVEEDGELKEIIRKLKELTSGTLRDYSYYQAVRIHKIFYLPT